MLIFITGFFPQYEQRALAIVPELKELLVEVSRATATSQMAKAIRKQCMANRLVAFLLQSPGFIFEPAASEDPAARLLKGLVRREESPAASRATSSSREASVSQAPSNC